jgi:acylphosphatase
MLGAMHHVRAEVRGRVQGVGFRWFALRRAGEHGVRGYVRNLGDGSVEVVAEGEREALERFLDDLRAGPQGARVDDVDLHWSEGPGLHRGFGIEG